MVETEHFINDGYGWTCKRCGTTGDAAMRETLMPDAGDGRARFFREGEAEDREPRLSTPALARWKDAPGHTLICPLCGAEEDLKRLF